MPCCDEFLNYFSSAMLIFTVGGSENPEASGVLEPQTVKIPPEGTNAVQDTISPSLTRFIALG